MKNFLGKGFAFPLHVNGRGQVETSAGEKSINESVRLILGTAVGERVMLPEFGCQINELVFHPVNAKTCSQSASRRCHSPESRRLSPVIRVPPGFRDVATPGPSTSRASP